MRGVLYTNFPQQVGHRHPAPALNRVPAAGAVERGLTDGVVEGENLFVGEGELALDLAVDFELPAAGLDAENRVTQPVGDGVTVTGEAFLLTRAGETAARPGGCSDHLLSAPNGEADRQQAQQAERRPPADQV